MIATKVPNFALMVKKYCESVRSGVRVAGRYEKMAVARYDDDLNNAGDRGWYLDTDIAKRACRFFALYCCHSMGEWARQPFILSPWQAFCWWNIQGWRNEDDDSRRFRKGYLTVSRKNGKTAFAAAAAVQLSFFDFPNEPVGRGFCAATKKEQAALLWSESRRMIEASPRLEPLCSIMGGKNRAGGQIIVDAGEQKGTTFEPVGSDSKTTDGLNPTFVWKDEIHEWRQRHRGLNEKLSTGGASRRQPFEGIITTAGDDDSEIWEEEHEFACRVVEAGSRGEVVDDSVFAFICQIDEEDDPLDEKCWPKANPNYGVSVKPKYLRAQAIEAVQKPSAYNQFVRYHCNRRVASFDQAYPPHLWERGNVKFDEPQKGDLCFIGFDIGRTNDWAAWSAVFPQKFNDNGEDKWRYVIKSKPYCCKGPNVSTDYASPPYSGWIADGLLGFQPDEVIDTAELKADILEMVSEYEVRSIPYDDSYAKELALDLFNNYGVPIYAFFQTHLRYNEPLIAFENALIEGRLSHGNCPVLNFQAGNCQYNYDPKGRRMLDKGNRQRWKKIDGMVAAIMAFSEAIYHTKIDANDDILIG
jgi:phage terminase large subunit-like protein